MDDPWVTRVQYSTKLECVCIFKIFVFLRVYTKIVNAVLVQIRPQLHDPSARRIMPQLSAGLRVRAIRRSIFYRWPLCSFAKHLSESSTSGIIASGSVSPYQSCFSTVAQQSARSPKSIRNVAVIAHVDVGKSTMVEGLIRECTSEELKMDTGELEQERGITIASKVTSVEHDGTLINIVDSPGKFTDKYCSASRI